MHNFTADAHPIHIHEIMFEVVNRQPIGGGASRPPESWEAGRKDTVDRLPRRDHAGEGPVRPRRPFVWHCHIVEHEDNEMMRPYRIGP